MSPRRVLVLVAVLGAGLLMILRSRGTHRDPIGPAATSAAEAPTPLALAEPEDVERSSAGVAASVEPRVSPTRSESTTPPDSTRACVVTFALKSAIDAEASKSTSVESTDERGRSLVVKHIDDRTFRATGVAPGSYRVAASWPGHDRACATFEVRSSDSAKDVELVLAASAPTPRRPVLVRWQTEEGLPFLPSLTKSWPAQARGSISVRVDGAPGPTAKPLTITRDERAATERVGRMMPGAPLDSLTYAIANVGRATSIEILLDAHVAATATIAENEDEIVVRTPIGPLLAMFGTVRGCVVDAEDRTPIEEARVELVVFPDRPPRAADRLSAPGCFEFDGLAPSTMRLSIVANGATSAREITLEPGQDLDLGPILVPRGCRLRARLVDAGGGPVERLVRLECFAGREMPDSQKGATSWSWDAGALVVDPAPERDGMLFVETKDHALATFALPPCGERGDVELRLVEGVEVALDLGLGEPAQEIVLTAADGTPLGQHRVTHTGLVPLRLAVGDYVARRTGSDAPMPFRVEAGTRGIVLR